MSNAHDDEFLMNLVDRAKSQPLEAREAWLYNECAGDMELFRAAWDYVRWDDHMGDFLLKPVDSSAAGEAAAGAMATGNKLGPYEIVARIGAGGMGEVYMARDTRLNRTVAIKVLPERIASRKDLRARLEREARAVASLNHPNICVLHDIGNQDGVGYLVMEHLEGETLAARLARGSLPIDQAVKLGTQIADALDRAHRAGVTHRDVKPQNIMLTRDGAKVLDFGLAKTGPTPAPGEAALTAKGAILGTPQYMAPERLDGKEADPRSDIWAFGAVLYEMATGRKAFQGTSYSGLVTAILSADPAPMEPFTPWWLERLVRRCLAKDPEDRWQTMRDVVIELRTPPQGEPVAQLSNAARWPWIVAATSTLLAAALGVVYWRAVQPPAAALKPLIKLDLDLGPDAITADSHKTFAISPGGERLVFTVRGADGKTRLATRLLSEDLPKILEGTQDPQDPFFSPDGAWIAYGAGGKLRKVSARGGTPTVICDAPYFYGGTWTDQGMLFAALFRESALAGVPAAGGVPQLLGKLSGVDIIERWPQALPGGEYILATAFGASSTPSIVGISTKTGETRHLVEGAYAARYLAGPVNGLGGSDFKYPGYLLYLRGSSLFAVGFDPAKLEKQVREVLVADEVSGQPAVGVGHWDVSRNGVLIYSRGKAATDKTYQIVWLDRTGQTRDLVSERRHYTSMTFSPDGNRLALSAVRGDGFTDMFVYDLTRDVMTRLISVGKSRFLGFPVWTPDGKHIISAYPGPSGFGLAWYRADDGGALQILLDSSVFVVPNSISSDGSRVAYTRQDQVSSADIWTLPLDAADTEHPKAGKPTVFLQSPAFEGYAIFSPDSRWITYRSDETGRTEAYVRPYPGPGGKVQISNDGGNYPLWSSDGRSLYFQSHARVMVVDCQVKGGEFIPGRARQWAPASVGGGPLPYAIHPDGKRFATIPALGPSPKEKGNPHLTFLLNFGDELRRLVAGR